APELQECRTNPAGRAVNQRALARFDVHRAMHHLVRRDVVQHEADRLPHDPTQVTADMNPRNLTPSLRTRKNTGARRVFVLAIWWPRTVDPIHPSLYQINTRVWLTQLSWTLGRAATLDDIPELELDRIAGMGFDWVWPLSVWQTGPAGRKVSRETAGWRREFEETLPDLAEDDIAGSGFAIVGYTVGPTMGGDAALARFRHRLKERGLGLMLDFVPNHTALDHPWVEEHPEYFVGGSDLDRARAPGNYSWIHLAGDDRLLAHGRDPYFPGWPDTLQLDYGNPATQDAMIAVLEKVAERCDGVRCDMAMLVLPEVFERTWGRKTEAFWPRATRHVRERFPGFRFMAEVYWNLEWTLQKQGFDYTYDKRLYDRLRAGHALPFRD